MKILRCDCESPMRFTVTFYFGKMMVLYDYNSSAKAGRTER